MRGAGCFGAAGASTGSGAGGFDLAVSMPGGEPEGAADAGVLVGAASPPISSASRRVIASRGRCRHNLRVVGVALLKRAEQLWAALRRGTPMPLSRTSTRTSSRCRAARITRAPRDRAFRWNLTALLARLRIAWVKRVASPRTRRGGRLDIHLQQQALG